uniref:hypothetical protein n=1 Tax=uncultured Draconibacterium sp. TaxID=1573823 RepID=UPI003216FB8B
MEEYNIEGKLNSLESLFQPLNARMLKIETSIYKRLEIENCKEDCLAPIIKYVFAYPYENGAAMLKSTVDDLSSLIEIVNQNSKYINVTASWRSNPDNGIPSEKLIEELTDYRDELGFILQKVADKDENIKRYFFEITNQRIETNLTIEQLGGLLYILIKHSNVFITDALNVCRTLSKVLTSKKSKSPSGDYLYNMMLKAPKNKDVIKLWQDKCIDFYNNPIVENSKKKII